MKTKAFLFLGALFGLLLISSVTATETPQDVEKIDEEKEANEVKEPNQWGQGGRSCRGQGGCCRWSRQGYGCLQCCYSAANEVSEADHEVNGGYGGGGYGGGYGGRGGGWGGGRGGGWGGGRGGGWGRGGGRGCRWPGC